MMRATYGSEAGYVNSVMVTLSPTSSMFTKGTREDEPRPGQHRQKVGRGGGGMTLWWRGDEPRPEQHRSGGGGESTNLCGREEGRGMSKGRGRGMSKGKGRGMSKGRGGSGLMIVQQLGPGGGLGLYEGAYV